MTIAGIAFEAVSVFGGSKMTVDLCLLSWWMETVLEHLQLSLRLVGSRS